MQIWVDADACPAVIKEILYRVAERLQMNVTLVANQLLRVPPSRFVRAVRKKGTPIALLLMDQSVAAGIGNVYRAEMLYRARLNPHTPGKQVPEELVRELWRDWARLLPIGVETGQMMTMDDLSSDEYRAAMASRDDRHWVYHRAGLPCRTCGTEIVLEELGARKLYWCPRCQA